MIVQAVTRGIEVEKIGGPSLEDDFRSYVECEGILLYSQKLLMGGSSVLVFVDSDLASLAARTVGDVAVAVCLVLM